MSVRSFTAGLGRGDWASRQGQLPLDTLTQAQPPDQNFAVGGYCRMPQPVQVNTPLRSKLSLPSKLAGGAQDVEVNSLAASSTSPASSNNRRQQYATWDATARATLMGNCPYDIVVVGTSLGGLHALEILLAGLPKGLPISVAIAQHRHKNSDNTLSVFLQRHCALPLSEAEDKEAIEPGHVYLAPADYHLLVESGRFALSTEAPVCHARPSIDVLFETAADAYGERAIGVILTGASDDGARGLASIKANGGLVIVQEPTTAECATMPNAAINVLRQRSANATIAIDWILPLCDIAPLIVNLCHPALR